MKLDIPTARAFVPLLEPNRYKGAWGGRGSGKSRFFAGLAVDMATAKPGFRLLCVREVQKSLKESVKQLIEDEVRRHKLTEHFDCLTAETKTPGGGLITYAGMQDHTADSIKSFEGYDACWVEEAQTLSQRSLELLRPTIRKPGSELWFSWNPRSAQDPVDKLLRGENPPERSCVVKALYSDNPWFPAELEAERQHDLAHNRDRYGHIWLGDYEPMAIGAIWDRATLHAYRRADKPRDLARVLVAVDPAVSSEAGSDEHGIIVVGLGEDGRGYVLDDFSMKGTPREWANRALSALDLYEADSIVIEINQGGDMCRNTLEAARPGVMITEVRATRGKHVRAEPISALYSLGRVSHCGTFGKLEDQMCSMTAAGYEGDGSPDRCDALVWGLTELFGDMAAPRSKASRSVVEPFSAPVGEGGWMS